MNIYEKMLAITSELQAVAKNLTVGFGKNQYNAVGERDVLDAVKPLEEKYKVYSYPVSRKILESHLLENEAKANGEMIKKTSFMTRIETVYRFVNVENPDEFIETTTFAEGIDSQDKGSGKAMTYSDKYALMKAYKISTGDDPDQKESNVVSYKAKPKTSREKLIEQLKKDNVNINAFAEANNITTSTSEAEFKMLLDNYIKNRG